MEFLDTGSEPSVPGDCVQQLSKTTTSMQSQNSSSRIGIIKILLFHLQPSSRTLAFILQLLKLSSWKNGHEHIHHGDDVHRLRTTHTL